MHLKLRDLAIFDAVVRHGSIQGAAEAVGVTQSAVTKVIQRLEQDLGHILLDRSQRPLRLTKDGERAIAHARGVLGAMDEMKAAFRSGAVPAGKFRLGLSHALTNLLLDADDLLGLQAFPQLQPAFISGWSDELLTSLHGLKLDGAITLSLATESQTGASLLASSAIHIVSNNHNAGQVRDLQSANRIGWALNPSGCGYRRTLLRALEQDGQTPNIVLETNSLDLQLAFVREGRALTLAPDFLKSLLPSADDLRFLIPQALDASVNVLLHRVEGAASFRTVYKELEESVRKKLGPPSI